MLRVFTERFRQGYRTARYPKEQPKFSARYPGRPVLLPHMCSTSCREDQRFCSASCPTSALTKAGPLQLDLGKCLICRRCATACPNGAITFAGNYQMASSRRSGLVIADGTIPEVAALASDRLALFRRSLKLRQVSAGGCNACEADANVLGTLAFDMGRFGIQFVASPRHADGLLVTGPVSSGMLQALRRTWDALPEPRVLILSGSCAISGGPFADLEAVSNGATDLLPVDLFVPGCPPHPYTLLDGLLRLLGRVPVLTPAK